jgi:hypothetical protein
MKTKYLKGVENKLIISEVIFVFLHTINEKREGNILTFTKRKQNKEIPLTFC